MKKLLSFVVAGGLLAGSAAMASATDIKVKGTFDFGFGLYSNTSFQKHGSEENFDALQRFRTQIDFIASESLKGVAAFEIGNTNWGGGGGGSWNNGGTGAGRGAGGALGADGVAVEVKHLYIDWIVPDTDLRVRMGIQPLANPRAVKRADGEDGAFIVDDDMAGILLSYDFNDDFGINFGWYRLFDGSITDSDTTDRVGTRYGDHDEVDMFYLSLPFEMKDSFSITPYGMYALVGDNLGREVFVGKDSTTGKDKFTNAPFDSGPSSLSADGSLGNDGDLWWAGVAFDLSAFDPFVAAVDFAYGSYSSDDVAGKDVDRSGWVVVSKFGYKLDYFTPNLFAWYGSGADDIDDGMDGMMPTLSADFGLTSFGWSNASPMGREFAIGDSPAGTWAIGLGLDDIKFIDNLTSQFRVAYFQGTNDYAHSTFESNDLLTNDDDGFEVNLDNVINVYDNLDMYVELGYINLSLDDETTNFDGDAWKSYVGFRYSF